MELPRAPGSAKHARHAGTGDNRQSAVAAGCRRMGADRPAVDALGQLVFLHRSRPAGDAGPDDHGAAHDSRIGRSHSHRAVAGLPHAGDACRMAPVHSLRRIQQRRCPSCSSSGARRAPPAAWPPFSTPRRRCSASSWRTCSPRTRSCRGTSWPASWSASSGSAFWSATTSPWVRVPTCWPGLRCSRPRCFTCAPTFLPGPNSVTTRRSWWP